MTAPATAPATDWDLLVLSPHLDDAALSCGGEIAGRAAAGERVLVVTAGTGDEPAALDDLSPVARALHRAWRLARGAVAARRREDEAACRLLGAVPLHLGLREAIYRRAADGTPFYGRLEDLFAPPPADDVAWADELAGRLAALPAARQVLVPLGVGRHVDHLLTRRAAEAVYGDVVVYYEELPYLEDAAAGELAPAPTSWERVARPVPRAAFRVQCAALAAYRSQVRPLFGGPWRMRRRLARAHRREGGEPRWQRRRDPL